MIDKGELAATEPFEVGFSDTEDKTAASHGGSTVLADPKVAGDTALGSVDAKNEWLRRTAPALHVYFDMSDLVFYIGHHDNLTGIQRVQASIVLALTAERDDLCVHFLTYSTRQKNFLEVDPVYFLDIVSDLSRPPAERRINFDKMEAREGRLSKTVPFKPDKSKDLCLCLLGAAWVNPDYFLRIRNLKARYGFRLATLIHDLIPIFARETCDQGTAERFSDWLNQSHGVVDQYLTVSENTKTDLLRYFESLDQTISEPVVTKNGGSLPFVGEDLDITDLDRELRPGNYVLFVSTIEGRKNHLNAFRALQLLKKKLGEVPFLVCVGRLGWRAEPFMVACEASNYLDGSIKILSDISDAELAALYKGCLFTIYPSFYEGWGLPVGESLSSGKVCITSSTTSLPEVGGSFASYVDPARSGQLADRMFDFLSNPRQLIEREQAIRAGYKPVEWAEVARNVVGACRNLFSGPTASPSPIVRLGREYPISVPPRLPPGLMGDKMLDAIRALRGRLISSGVFADEDYEIGQNVRMGEGWLPPDADGAFILQGGAEIAFRAESPASEPLLLYLNYKTHPEHVGRHLLASSSGRGHTNTALRSTGILAISVQPRSAPDGGSEAHVTLKFNDSWAQEPSGGAHQVGNHVLQVRSFIVVRESDASARLELLERSLLRATQPDGSASTLLPDVLDHRDRASESRIAFVSRFMLGTGQTLWGPLLELRRSLLLARARRAARAHNWAAAETAYRRLLRLDPSQPYTWIQYGHVVKEGGDRAAAIGAYEMATKIDPSVVDGFVQLGHALEAEDRPDDARRAFRRAEGLRSASTQGAAKH